MPESEKRQSHRFEFRQILGFELSATQRLTSSPERRALGIDISSGGLGLEAEETLQKGEVVKLLVPFGVGNTNIPVFAEVRWVATFGERYRMGFQFLA